MATVLTELTVLTWGEVMLCFPDAAVTVISGKPPYECSGVLHQLAHQWNIPVLYIKSYDFL